MSECDECGDRITGFLVAEVDGDTLCEGCRRARKDTPEHREYHSPGDRERNREALDHRAARSRQRVLDNVANQGGRL